jgi:hypothetical protein
MSETGSRRSTVMPRAKNHLPSETARAFQPSLECMIPRTRGSKNKETSTSEEKQWLQGI